jgi:hypothetical protein
MEYADAGAGGDAGGFEGGSEGYAGGGEGYQGAGHEGGYQGEPERPQWMANQERDWANRLDQMGRDYSAERQGGYEDDAGYEDDGASVDYEDPAGDDAYGDDLGVDPDEAQDHLLDNAPPEFLDAIESLGRQGELDRREQALDERAAQLTDVSREEGFRRLADMYPALRNERIAEGVQRYAEAIADEMGQPDQADQPRFVHMAYLALAGQRYIASGGRPEQPATPDNIDGGLEAGGAAPDDGAPDHPFVQLHAKQRAHLGRRAPMAGGR